MQYEKVTTLTLQKNPLRNYT